MLREQVSEIDILFGILDQEPGGILLDAVKVFLEAEVAVPHGDGMFNADVADMPFLGGEAGDIGFILLEIISFDKKYKL